MGAAGVLAVGGLGLWAGIDRSRDEGLIGYAGSAPMFTSEALVYVTGFSENEIAFKLSSGLVLEGDPAGSGLDGGLPGTTFGFAVGPSFAAELLEAGGATSRILDAEQLAAIYDGRVAPTWWPHSAADPWLAELSFAELIDGERVVSSAVEASED